MYVSWQARSFKVQIARGLSLDWPTNKIDGWLTLKWDNNGRDNLFPQLYFSYPNSLFQLSFRIVFIKYHIYVLNQSEQEKRWSDGKIIISVSYNCSVRLWNPSKEPNLKASFCSPFISVSVPICQSIRRELKQLVPHSTRNCFFAFLHTSHENPQNIHIEDLRNSRMDLKLPTATNGNPRENE